MIVVAIVERAIFLTLQATTTQEDAEHSIIRTRWNITGCSHLEILVDGVQTSLGQGLLSIYAEQGLNQ